MSEFNQTFVVIPSRIWNLEGITLSFLKVYETIFQFWNNGKKCFLTNESIMQRTGINSERTIQDAFVFFEYHKELKRKTNEKTGQRFLLSPLQYLEIEKEQNNKPVDNPRNELLPPPQKIAPPPAKNCAHNINNININKLNKSSYKANEQKQNSSKKHDWAEKVNNEPKQTAKFWEPGNPDYDRLHENNKKVVNK